MGDDDAVLLFVFVKIGGQCVFFFRRSAAHRAKIELRQLTVAYFLTEYTEAFRVLRSYYYPAGVAVDAVAQRGSKAHFVLRGVFALLIKIVLYAVDERIGAVFPAVSLVDEKPRSLVRQKYIFVLIDDINLRRGAFKIISVRCRLFLTQKLLRRENAYLVPLPELVSGFGPPAADFYILLPDKPAHTAL